MKTRVTKYYKLVVLLKKFVHEKRLWNKVWWCLTYVWLYIIGNISWPSNLLILNPLPTNWSIALGTPPALSLELATLRSLIHPPTNWANALRTPLEVILELATVRSPVHHSTHRSLTLIFFFIPVYPLRSKVKDGHSATAQIVSGWITPLLFSLRSRAYTIWTNNCILYPPPYIRSLPHSRF